MEKKDLFYIEDANQRKLFYRFTPAAFASNFVPLVIVLDDKEKAEVLNFEYKMWHVLTPIDDFSSDKSSPSWIGEKGDVFIKDLLQELIEKIADEYECEEHIYLYGNASGTYGAILHGLLCKANAVYAKIAQTHYADIKEKVLSSLLDSKDSSPIFYLCEDEPLLESDLEAKIRFLDTCKTHNIHVYQDFCPDAKEDDTYVLKKVLDMFEHVPPEFNT